MQENLKNKYLVDFYNNSTLSVWAQREMTDEKCPDVHTTCHKKKYKFILRSISGVEILTRDIAKYPCVRKASISLFKNKNVVQHN